jgi:hypothetical protein
LLGEENDETPFPVFGAGNPRSLNPRASSRTCPRKQRLACFIIQHWWVYPSADRSWRKRKFGLAKQRLENIGGSDVKLNHVWVENTSRRQSHSLQRGILCGILPENWNISSIMAACKQNMLALNIGKLYSEDLWGDALNQ